MTTSRTTWDMVNTIKHTRVTGSQQMGRQKPARCLSTNMLCCSSCFTPIKESGVPTALHGRGLSQHPTSPGKYCRYLLFNSVIFLLLCTNPHLSDYIHMQHWGLIYLLGSRNLIDINIGFIFVNGFRIFGFPPSILKCSATILIKFWRIEMTHNKYPCQVCI